MHMHDQQPDPQSAPQEPPKQPESHASAPATPVVTSHEPKQPEQPNRLLAACSYLGILFLIPLLAEKDDEFVRFHVRQGIVLFALEVIVSLGFLNESAGSLLCLVLIVISLVAAFRTYQGKKWLLPIVGEHAQRIKL